MNELNYIYSKNILAKLLTWKKWYYKNNIDKINFCIENIDKLYVNHKKLLDKEKEKYTRIALNELKDINKSINDKILKKYDKNLLYFLYWWISKKNHIMAVKSHWREQIRSSIILDLTKYFEHISYDNVVLSLQKIKIANKKWAKIIADLSCVDIWENSIKWWNRVIARWFHTSTRLAIISSLQFFKNLEWLVKDEFKLLDPQLSVVVDDITISFNNTSKEKIDCFLGKVEKLSKKFNFPFNKNKEKININKEIKTLGLIQKSKKTSVTKEFKKWLNQDFKDLNNWDKTKYDTIKWKLNYIKQVKKT